MADFEEQLMGGIPLHEAAEFFVRVKQPSINGGYLKEASVKMAGAAADLMDQLAAGGPMPEGKAGRFKKVDQVKEAAVGKAFKRGVDVLTGAAGKKARGAAAKHKAVAGGTEAELKKTLDKTPFYRKGSRSDIQDSMRRARAGRRADAVAGREEARTRKARAGMAAGAAALGIAGASKKDKMKKAAQAMKLAFGMGEDASEGELGGGPNMQGGQPMPAAQGAPGMPAPEAMSSAPVQDPAAAVPSTPPTMPVNYMAAEQMARAAQEANEVGFLRERLNRATEQNNALQSQMGEVQTQLQQIQQQSQQTGDQVMAATAEAVNASERALHQTMQAANMRIGINKMREAFMQLASQEPEQLGTLAQQEQVQAQQAEQAAVDAQAGTPEQSASPETGTGSPSAEAPESGGPGPESGGSGASEPASSKSTSPNINIKTGSVPWAVPGAVAGAGLAALHGRKMTQGGEELEQEVAGLEQEQDPGSFGKAVELAKAKMRLAESELFQKHPLRANLGNIAGGALGGAMMGSAGEGLMNAIKHRV